MDATWLFGITIMKAIIISSNVIIELFIFHLNIGNKFSEIVLFL
jgi:hypothetical protein